MKTYDGKDETANQSNQMIIAQRLLECCGVKSPREWSNTNNQWVRYLNATGINESFYYLPATCCGENSESPEASFSCTEHGVNGTRAMTYTEGCYEKLLHWGPYVGIVVVVLIFIQILILCITCWLQRKTRDGKYAEWF